MFERIQVIKEVNGDNNIIINGDVTAGNEVLTKVANYLLSAELSKLTSFQMLVVRMQLRVASLLDLSWKGARRAVCHHTRLPLCPEWIL